MKDNQEIFKDIALLDEIETAARLIRLGFGELQNIGFSNSFYFLPFQLLSQGFERLMKSYLCNAYHYKHNTYPDFQFIKNLGHDLESLLAEILANYFDDHNKFYLIGDKDFLTGDPELKSLLHILSEFGKMARYHNFDIITASKKPSVNPKELWESFEHGVLQKLGYDKLGDRDLEKEVYGDISRHIIIILEKYVVGLSRQYNFGTLGDRAKQFSAHLFDFAMIYPDKLGKTDYRQLTSTYKAVEIKAYKRGVIDELKRHTYPDYRWKKIYRRDYQGEWPFYADEVIIECRYKHWCVVTIDGYDYALNGSAAGRYKLETPHDAGMAILGISVGDFISMAFALNNK